MKDFTVEEVNEQIFWRHFSEDYTHDQRSCINQVAAEIRKQADRSGIELKRDHDLFYAMMGFNAYVEFYNRAGNGEPMVGDVV